MRVVIASRIFAPEAAAAAFRLKALARALSDRGADVVVLTTRTPDSDGDSALPEEILVKRAPVLRDRTGAVRGYVQYLSFDIPLFFRLMLGPRVDVVIAEPPPTTGAVVRLACAIRRVPYVYYAADILSDAAASSGAPSVVVRAVRAMEKWVLRGAKAVLSVSPGVTERLSEIEPSVSVDTVGNGVDATLFAYEGKKKEMGAPYLLYAGTASEVHGAAIFVEAFEYVLRQYPEARLVFIGQGSERERIASNSSLLPPGSVLFEPRMPAAKVAEWLRGASASLASVKPGLGYDFAFPTKMYASVACGTPVIYAGVGPGREFAAHPIAGWTVDYSVGAVAQGMLAAISAPIDDRARFERAEWAARRLSLAAVAARAADAVSRAAGG